MRLRDALWLAGAALVAGGCDPNNEDPIVLTINGESISSILGVRYLAEPLMAEVGETLEITFDIKDADNDPTFVWWAGSPPGWDFPPDSHSGSWAVPEDYWVEFLQLYPVVTDDKDPAGTDMVWMVIYVEGAIVPVEDTGETWGGDSGLNDSGLNDSGLNDSGLNDSGLNDSGLDTGAGDSGSDDTGGVDTGS
jgi:hypothetical protein